MGSIPLKIRRFTMDVKHFKILNDNRDTQIMDEQPGCGKLDICIGLDFDDCPSVDICILIDFEL